MVDVGDIRTELSLIYSQFKSALKSVEKISKNTGQTIEQTLGTKLTKNLKGAGDQMSRVFGGKAQRDIQKTAGFLGSAGSKTYGYLKDVKRIASGILLSQVLYRGILQPIQEATKALWNFMVQMEQAYLALELMLGGLSQATLFLRELESFAAVTPFQMADVVKNTRQLLGYGFAAREVLPILEALSDASAIIGVSPAQLTQLVTTIGKVRAQGRMMARQLISFGAAGIPIFQILREELDLTKEEIRNIGRQFEGQADIVIPAILRGLERKFGGASERLARTVGGLLSTVQDDLLLISKDVFEGLYETFRGFLSRITDRLEELRDIVVKYGVGGLFEAMVPEQYQETIRQLIAHMISFGRAVAQLWQALAPLREILFEIFIRVMSALVPILSIAAQALAKFAHWAFYSTTVLSRLALSLIVAITIMKMFTIVLGIAQAISKLAAMVGLASTAMNKWGLIIMVVLAALIALAMSIPKVRKAVQGLWEQLMGFFGLDTSKLLQPIEVEDVVDADALYDQLHVVHEGAQQIEDDFEDVEDQVKDTQKALKKYLLAFDEVYAIPEKYDKLTVPDIGKIDIPEVSDMMFEPEMEWPDWTAPAEEEIGELGNLFDGLLSKILAFFKNLWGFIKTMFKAWIQLIKDLWNAWIQLMKDLWNAVKQLAIDVWNALKNLFVDLGKALWQFIKDIWKAITDFAKGIIDAFKTLWKDLLSAKSFADIVDAFKTFFGTMWDLVIKFGGDIGKAFFTWISSVVEAFGRFYESIQEAWANFWDNIETAYSNFFERVKDAYTKFFQSWREAWEKFFVDTFGSASGKIFDFGNFIINWMDDIYNNIVTKIGEISNSITTKLSNIFKLPEIDIGAGLGEILRKIFVGAFAFAWEGIINFFKVKWEEFYSFWESFGDTFGERLHGITAYAFGRFIGGIIEGFSQAWELTKEWVPKIVNAIVDFFKELPEKIAEAFRIFAEKMKEGFIRAWELTKEWVPKIVNAIVDFFKELPEKIAEELRIFVEKFKEGFARAWELTKEWVPKIVNAIVDFFKELPEKIKAEFIRMIEWLKDIIPRLIEIGRGWAESFWKGFTRGWKASTDIDIPGVDMSTGGIGVGSIPGMAKGGILNKEQIVRAAEGGRPEAYTPLTAKALKPWAEAIASALGSTEDGAQTPSIEEIGYVAVPIDKKGMMDLDKKLFVLRRRENIRRSVGVT